MKNINTINFEQIIIIEEKNYTSPIYITSENLSPKWRKIVNKKWNQPSTHEVYWGECTTFYKKDE